MVILQRIIVVMAIVSIHEIDIIAGKFSILMKVLSVKVLCLLRTLYSVGIVNSFSNMSCWI